MGAIDAIFALAIAFIFYGAGPLYLASERKKPIRKLHYWLFCVLYDAVVFIALQLITGSSISPVNLAVTALLFGTIFYFVGLAILRKKSSAAAPPAQSAAPQSPAEPEAMPAPEPSPAPPPPVSSLPITETWYTCPACGCLLPTGEACACGYHPPKAEPPKAPVKKQKWPIIAVAVLAVALACSVFYNVKQADTNAQLSNDLSSAQLRVTAKQVTINNYQNTIASLREYNKYLQEDVEYMCGVSSDFDTSKLRHSVRNRNPFLR